jgi:NhaP-type Na+/H+ or K+/H+ antiporter
MLAIISFTFAAFLILHTQGTTQGISTLTIISIVFGVVIGLLGLMLSFLQWHHAKTTTASSTVDVVEGHRFLPLLGLKTCRILDM